VDLRGDKFETGMRQLANILRPHAPGKAQALDAASDIEQRRAEIYDLVANAEGDRALDRIMDFVHGFSNDERRVQDMVITRGNFRQLGAEQNRTLKEVRSERTEILKHALEVLDEVIETLTQKAA
jgi:archaellum component FlaC